MTEMILSIKRIVFFVLTLCVIALSSVKAQEAALPDKRVLKASKNAKNAKNAKKSAFPSASPSDIPSDVPSSYPSASPSKSPLPSLSPSASRLCSRGHYVLDDFGDDGNGSV
jgi:hypothetical protein